MPRKNHPQGAPTRLQTPDSPTALRSLTAESISHDDALLLMSVRLQAAQAEGALNFVVQQLWAKYSLSPQDAVDPTGRILRSARPPAGAALVRAPEPTPPTEDGSTGA